MITAKHMSAFKPYSIGIVADNKTLESSEILVIPVEINPFIDGDLGSEVEEIESKGKNHEDEEYTLKVKKSKVIKCKWLKWGGQRATAPDVRRGMRVMIYRFSDSNHFYWTSLGLDDHLYRLETITWLVSDDPEGTGDTPKSIDNSHSITMSAHDKYIQLQTVNTNGEEFTYKFKFDLDESIVTLTDDVDNYIYLDSKNTVIRAHNAEGTFAELNQKNINMYAPDSFSLKAEENVNIECKNYYLTVGENYTESIGADYASDVGGNVTRTVGGNHSEEVSGNVTLKCATYTCDTPQATFTGQVAVGGISVAPGSAGGSGGAEVAGQVTVQGSATFVADLTALKVTSTQPIDAPNV